MKTIKNISIALVLAIISLFLDAGSSYAKEPSDAPNSAEKSTVYDAIIVPGVPYKDGYWTQILLGRIYWANHLYKSGITKNIIYSGSAVYTPYIEAEIMAMYGKELGIPEDNIYTEINAEHSVENVYYSVQIAKSMGFDKVALATDPFQSRMMKWPSKRMDIEIDFIPFTFEALDTMEIKEIDIEAEQAFVEDFVSIEERESFFKRLRGTMGGNIKHKYKND